MDQRMVLIILALAVVLGIVWYATQTPTTSPTTPPAATTPTPPPAP
jgi:lipopolysaccharide export system protein LptC